MWPILRDFTELCISHFDQHFVPSCARSQMKARWPCTRVAAMKATAAIGSSITMRTATLTGMTRCRGRVNTTHRLGTKALYLNFARII